MRLCKTKYKSLFKHLDHAISLSTCLLQRLTLPFRTRFGWDAVNFPHSSLYGDVLCVYDQNSVSNTPVLGLLLHGDCTTSRLSLTHSQTKASRLQIDNRLG